MNVTDYTAIIGAIFAGLVLLMNTWFTLSTRQEVKRAAEDQGQKLDVIHEATNGGMASLEKKLAISDARAERLEKVIAKMQAERRS